MFAGAADRFRHPPRVPSPGVNLRGRYEGGGITVTTRRWWSPKHRKAARLAARLLHEPAVRPGVARLIARDDDFVVTFPETRVFDYRPL